MSTRDYFLNLASRIYLSPSEKVLDRCVDFCSQIKEDLKLLSSIDTKNLDIFYNFSDIKISIDTPQPSTDVENMEILRSLLGFYELPNIQDTK